MQIFSYLKNQFRHQSIKKNLKKKINVGVKLSKKKYVKKNSNNRFFFIKINVIK